MPEQPRTIIPPQNFAVAARGFSAAQDAEEKIPRSVDDFIRLARRRTEAWERWWRLYSDPDVWTDMAKRSEMCSARLQYHDAYFELLCALGEDENH
jgi:hypothetical protein